MEGDIQISENKLEGFFYDHLTGIKPIKNFPFEVIDLGCVYRQFDLGSYGVADIVTFDIDYDGSINVEIIEFKKTEINKNSLTQILRYKAGIEFFLNKNNIKIEHLCCSLIGRKLSSCDGFCVAVGSLDFLSIYEYDLCPSTGLILELQEKNFTSQVIPEKTKKILSSISYKSADNKCKLYLNNRVE